MFLRYSPVEFSPTSWNPFARCAVSFAVDVHCTRIVLFNVTQERLTKNDLQGHLMGLAEIESGPSQRKNV